MTEQPEVRIDVVGDEVAGELLTLRRAAFVKEAQSQNDPHIPPLTQTLNELRADLADPLVITLGAWSGHRLVGSIRVALDGDRAILDRLAVAPDLQHQGIGVELLLAVPAHLPENARQVWVATGEGSAQNLAAYAGDTHERGIGDLIQTYLRKILGSGEVAEVPQDDAAASPRP